MGLATLTSTSRLCPASISIASFGGFFRFNTFEPFSQGCRQQILVKSNKNTFADWAGTLSTLTTGALDHTFEIAKISSALDSGLNLVRMCFEPKTHRQRLFLLDSLSATRYQLTLPSGVMSFPVHYS